MRSGVWHVAQYRHYLIAESGGWTWPALYELTDLMQYSKPIRGFWPFAAERLAFFFYQACVKGRA